MTRLCSTCKTKGVRKPNVARKGQYTCLPCHREWRQNRRAARSSGCAIVKTTRRPRVKVFTPPPPGRPSSWNWRGGMAHDARLENKPCAAHPGQARVLETRTVASGYVQELGGYQHDGYTRRRWECKVCRRRWTVFEKGAVKKQAA